MKGTRCKGPTPTVAKLQCRLHTFHTRKHAVMRGSDSLEALLRCESAHITDGCTLAPHRCHTSEVVVPQRHKPRSPHRATDCATLPSSLHTPHYAPARAPNRPRISTPCLHTSSPAHPNASYQGASTRARALPQATTKHTTFRERAQVGHRLGAI